MAIIDDANRKIFFRQLSLVLECLARKRRESDMSCCAACAGTAACRFLRQAGDAVSSNLLSDPETDRAAKNGSAGERRAEGILFCRAMRQPFGYRRSRQSGPGSRKQSFATVPAFDALSGSDGFVRGFPTCSSRRSAGNPGVQFDPGLGLLSRSARVQYRLVRGTARPRALNDRSSRSEDAKGGVREAKRPADSHHPRRQSATPGRPNGALCGERT